MKPLAHRSLSLCLIAMLLLAPALAVGVAPAHAQPGLTVPVTGAVQNGGTFAGNFTITKFVSQGGDIFAVGTLTGTLVNAVGVVTSVVKNIRIPVTAITGSCDILHLELGPLDLDLLGLQVHLDKIVLDIDAQAGPGNLLGNLLCAIAGLLNAGGPLSQIVNLLNQILALL